MSPSETSRNYIRFKTINSNTNVDQKIKKCIKLMGRMRRPSVNLPLNALLAIYKYFIRSHMIKQTVKIFRTKWKKFSTKPAW